MEHHDNIKSDDVEDTDTDINDNEKVAIDLFENDKIAADLVDPIAIDDIKDVTISNIKKAQDRGVNLEELDKKSLKLEQNVKLFKKSSRKLKYHFCKKYYKLIGIITTIFIIIVIILGFIIGKS